nr:MAG: internal scaffolding protein [Microvirus sp.]
MTKQSFKDECDINCIMAKFQKTGALNHYASRSPEYGDATPVALHDAQNIVANANTMFEELPSSIRKKFDNDPGTFLEFVQDEKNQEEMISLGLKNSPPLSDNQPDKPPIKSASAPPKNSDPKDVGSKTPKDPEAN